MELLDYVRQHAREGDANAVIAAIDAFSTAHGGMIHLGPEKGELFDQVVAGSGALRVLELGTNYGYSALRMSNHLASAARVRTVEIDRDTAQTAEAIIAHAGRAEQIEVICGQASDVLPTFTENFDLVFIDHTPGNYLVDLEGIERLDLLRQGGTLISDNVLVFERQLEPYLRHLRTSRRYDSRKLEPSPGADAIEVSIRLR
ncbi:MAG: class I SAM-dependent methyltransferase [Pseudomonadota bacterium]